MTVRPGTIVTVIFIVAVGFAIGAWLAIRTRGPVEPAQRVTVATSVSASRPVRAPPPLRILTPAPTPTVVATATSIATAAPTAKAAAATPSAVSTVVPSAAPAAAVANPALQGSWQLDEANVQVGTISWVGDAVLGSGNTIVFNMHKQNVGGRTAMPCERQTGLHAAFSLGATDQTVPYREVNCEGAVSTGEVRVTGFSRNAASFSGRFSRNGVNLGTFNARKL
ncbi:MAG TPA: hypothetical protein VN224_14595 [Xanthomonadales bacterium]|nr:hypothetical protein [Xanthomonadales bacterium]